MRPRDLGRLGEKAARDFLAGRGYEILETNYRTRQGEIDLITRKGDWVSFVEVKARTSHILGSPQEAVTPRKLERLQALALEYLATHPHLPPNWRIDVLALDLDQQGRVLHHELIENAYL